VEEPHHRAAHALLVDEGELVLKIGPPVQVEEFRGALGVVARQRMRRDIVDLGVSDPDIPAVIERLKILFAGAKQGVPPGIFLSRAVVRPRCC
jgi:hypothetical protein